MLQVEKSQIDTLKRNIKGRIILPEDPEYDKARAIWNGMIDRKPAIIVQCESAEDVPHVIHFAKEKGLELSARGGGHHIAGNSIAENGLTIDFSRMRNIQVDAARKRAVVEPGATLGAFDKATQAHGLATPTGINSTTGIAGLTLGGGFGWLTRQYGLTIDNLVSADIVTANGDQLTVSKSKNPDLFWAIRGGGGNFGVVTRFEYKLYDVGPEIFAGLIVFPFEQARKVLNQYREFTKSAPLELNAWVVIRYAPPLPFLPEEVHHKMVVVLPVFYNGDVSKGENLVKYLRKFGNPVGEHVGPQPYVQWQQAFDPLLTPGSRNYWKSHNFTEINDGLIDSIIRYSGTMPTLQTEIFLGMLSGVANQVPVEATAYAARDARFVVNVHGRWEEPIEDQKCVGWARDFFVATRDYASGGAYINFMTADESDRVSEAYGSNYRRLVDLKTQYDPDNIFHMNQNIKPRSLTQK
ncbi:FAD-binding oxidoreductase [Aliifodinibius sp. S!AR15-10]|uniref:FAD-binding oxidoreductase n=1 Tax=Aliifodinibius sp. S!AR15-10 TaxID=2950437 RepID=UPI002856D023|nr:FAD-binding oxidoreductase [Aliifodinibius sp. S!AR15-10]MDR8393927.1 FAD-binding oxidoreductase [Aliifodinibius sp. S!AR15-10]